MSNEIERLIITVLQSACLCTLIFLSWSRERELRRLRKELKDRRPDEKTTEGGR